MKYLSIDKKQMSNIYKKIGSNVKKSRESKGLSQLALALAIGHKAVGMISLAELHKNNKHFNIEQLFKIANVLDVDINEFFKEIEYKKNKS